VLAVNYFYTENMRVENSQIDRPLDERSPAGDRERVELFHLEILMTEFDSPARETCGNYCN
jgi:hypothetical protein